MVNTFLRDATLQRQIENLLRQQEAAVRRAFMMSINDIRNRITLRELRDAIAENDIPRAIRALNLEPAAYGTFSEAIRNTYTQAGAVAMSGTVWRFPDLSRAQVRWDFDNPRARQWLLNWSSTKITGDLIPSQITAVRGVIEAGYGLGRNPRNIALDIVGRIGANGRRTGGVLGLNGPQQQWVSNMRNYLTNDPVRALNMTRRDRRFDAAIRKAIETGTPLKQEQIDRMVGRYSDRLLQSRGNAIARTETAQAVNSARQEAMQQGLDAVGISDEFIEKVWLHGGAAETKARPDHEAMHRESVMGLNTPFVLPSGATCQYPLDPALGAEEVINCRCSYVTRVRYDLLAR
jgi:hypothetical protein